MTRVIRRSADRTDAPAKWESAEKGIKRTVVFSVLVFSRCPVRLTYGEYIVTGFFRLDCWDGKMAKLGPVLRSDTLSLYPWSTWILECCSAEVRYRTRLGIPFPSFWTVWSRFSIIAEFVDLNDVSRASQSRPWYMEQAVWFDWSPLRVLTGNKRQDALKAIPHVKLWGMHPLIFSLLIYPD